MNNRLSIIKKNDIDKLNSLIFENYDSLMIYPLSYILEIEDEGNEDTSEKNDSDSIEKNNSDVNFENGILSDEEFKIIIY